VSVVYTDGLCTAGTRSSQSLDVPAIVQELAVEQDANAQQLADGLLHQAVELDQGRPQDDISVLVLRVQERSSDGVRRMAVRLPI
jgi:serine phosphatase RsbU (regulator of sigma subunit)